MEIEERSFVAKGAPLDDGQKRIGDGETLRQSRVVKAAPSSRSRSEPGRQDGRRSYWVAVGITSFSTMGTGNGPSSKTWSWNLSRSKLAPAAV